MLSLPLITWFLSPSSALHVCFRYDGSGAILTLVKGVYARHLQGNASSEAAALVGLGAEALANVALDIAQRTTTHHAGALTEIMTTVR